MLTQDEAVAHSVPTHMAAPTHMAHLVAMVTITLTVAMVTIILLVVMVIAVLANMDAPSMGDQRSVAQLEQLLESSLHSFAAFVLLDVS